MATPPGPPPAAAPTGRTTTSGAATTPKPPAPLSAPLAPPPPPPSRLALYLHALLHPPPAPLPRGGVYAAASSLTSPWGQTERQRVYNALLAVPYQLERLLWFGGGVCADGWASAFTSLPLRCAGAAGRAVTAAVAAAASTPRPPWPQAGADLYDAACAAIFAGAAAALCAVPCGALYFWMKDLTQEFLKLHVIYTAIEIGDRIGCSFTVDALDALAGTCASFAAAPGPRARLALLPSLTADALLSAALVTSHGLVLMCHGMALAVAMHSTRGHTLLALTIAANFVELKGTIFKRFDGAKLRGLACQDVVERFHLGLALAFVLVEAAAAAGGGSGSGSGAASASAPPGGDSPAASPSSPFASIAPLLLRRCAQVAGAEVAIDLIKHAVVCKFNDVRPGMYREFFKDVCEAVVEGSGGEDGLSGRGGGSGGGGGGGDAPAAAEPSLHPLPPARSHGFQPQAGCRLLVFDPLAAAAFTVRIGVGWAAGRSSGGGEGAALSLAARAGGAAWWACAFALACAAKVGLGFALRVAAQSYLARYARLHGVGGRPGVGLKRE